MERESLNCMCPRNIINPCLLSVWLQVTRRNSPISGVVVWRAAGIGKGHLPPFKGWHLSKQPLQSQHRDHACGGCDRVKWEAHFWALIWQLSVEITNSWRTCWHAMLIPLIYVHRDDGLVTWIFSVTCMATRNWSGQTAFESHYPHFLCNTSYMNCSTFVIQHRAMKTLHLQFAFP